MKYLLLLWCLVLGGCVSAPGLPIDYDQVDTKPNGRLLPPPVLPQRSITEDSFYRDLETTHLTYLKKYHTYITRQVRFHEPEFDQPKPSCKDLQWPVYTPPSKPKLTNYDDPDEIIRVLTVYLKATQQSVLEYQSSIQVLEQRCKR